MNIMPVPDKPALLAEDISTLIVADLHIGIEYEIFKAGAKIPSGTHDLKKNLIEIIEKTGAKRLVIAGDVKHQVPGHSFQESRELPQFFDDILAHVEKIEITPGNHDGNLADFLPEKVDLHPVDGMVLEDGEIGIWHGHAWPSEEVMNSKLAVFAHYHPATLFIDGLGNRGAEKCWVRGQWNSEKLSARYKNHGNGFIMVPAFNPLCGGVYINEKRSWFGVVMKNELADLQNSSMYLIDGTYVGMVADNLVELDRERKQKKKNWLS